MHSKLDFHTVILIVDDHQILIDGISSLLSSSDAGCSVISANSVDEAIAVIKKQNRIDLILLDLFFPDHSGEALIHYCQGNIPIITMSSTNDLEIITNALSNGASGFIPKSCEAELLLQGIKTVVNGGKFIPENLNDKIRDYSQIQLIKPDSNRLSSVQKNSIPPKSLNVLRLMAKGLSNKEIAEQMNLSTETVKSHTKIIYSAFGVKNRLSATMKAKKLRLC